MKIGSDFGASGRVRAHCGIDAQTMSEALGLDDQEKTLCADVARVAADLKTNGVNAIVGMSWL